MAQYFDFSCLIKKYASDFTAIIPSTGDCNDAGDYVAGEPAQVTMNGAIINMRESRVMRSEGAYTTLDKALYMLEPLDKALMNAKIIHNGNVYTVDSELENSEFTGVWAYNLKYVSKFKGGDAK